MGKISVEKWMPQDIEALVKLISQVDDTYLRRDFPRPFLENHAFDLIDEAFTLEEKRAGFYRKILYNDELVGNISLSVDLNKGKDATVGYYIAPKFYGKGIATFALSKAITYAKKHLNIEAISAYVDYRNTASTRVLEKNGFKLHEVYHNETIKTGEKIDVLVYRLNFNRAPYKNNKRYYSLDQHFKEVFGKKVVKVALDIGATCPNLDGTKSTLGCSFCTGGSGDFACDGDIVKAFYDGVELISKKWPDALYIPYFQSYTNTYMPVEKLKEKVEKLIYLDRVVGISISTRPDCISNEMLDYLADLSYRTNLIVELGLQSSNNETLKAINRGHSYEDFLSAYKRLKEKHISVCIHIVDGLIGETKEDMLNTAREVAKLHPEYLKIHLLYFAKGTLDSKRLEEGLIKPLEKEEYVDILVSQLELIPSDVVMERLTGDGDKSKLIAPMYSTDKRGMLAAIDNALRDRETYQGRLYKK